MNVLKKALFLIPLLLLGMLLLPSHTTIDSSIYTNNPILTDDDYAIMLDARDPRGGGTTCNGLIRVLKRPNAQMNSIKITIYAAQQMNFQYLREVHISNPTSLFQYNSFLGLDEFYYNLNGLYKNLSSSPHNIILMTEIDTPNDNHTMFNDDEIVYPPFCQ